MNTEINKKYILCGVTIVTIGFAFYNLFKYKKALPCSSIEEEIEEIEENKKI
jgi:hypothetical protein